MGAGAGLGALEVVSRSGSPMWLVRGSYWAFSGWSWVGIRDTSEGSGQLLIKPWTSGADCPEVIVHPPGWSLEMAIWRRQVWLTAGWLPGLFIVDKGLFPGGLLQVVGQNSIFIYALAVVHLYIWFLYVYERHQILNVTELIHETDIRYFLTEYS